MLVKQFELLGIHGGNTQWIWLDYCKTENTHSGLAAANETGLIVFDKVRDVVVFFLIAW